MSLLGNLKKFLKSTFAMQVTLDNGISCVTETLEPGSILYTVTSDGEQEPATEGDYTTVDGCTISVASDGTITNYAEPTEIPDSDEDVSEDTPNLENTTTDMAATPDATAATTAPATDGSSNDMVTALNALTQAITSLLSKVSDDSESMKKQFAKIESAVTEPGTKSLTNVAMNAQPNKFAQEKANKLAKTERLMDIIKMKEENEGTLGRGRANNFR